MGQETLAMSEWAVHACFLFLQVCVFVPLL